MTRLRVYWAVLAIGAAFSVACAAQAQSQATDWGRRPALSPWFGLYQKNGGPLDNYHTFVRPQTELADSLQRQQADIQRNSAGINSLSEEMTQSQDRGAVRPTGTGSVFMNYSHYYPMSGAGGQATPGLAGRRRSLPPPAHSSGRPTAATAR